MGSLGELRAQALARVGMGEPVEERVGSALVRPAGQHGGEE